jgi:Tfp pilus assembly protein PilN
VVPSKFFGALAAGRPVLFAGPRDAAIARWIEEHGVGWVLDEQTQEQVAARLRSLASAPEALQDLQQHCQRIYQRLFSRRCVMDQWNRELLALLPSADGVWVWEGPGGQTPVSELPLTEMGELTLNPWSEAK